MHSRNELSGKPGAIQQRVDAELNTLLEQAAKKDVSYADVLDQVLALELQAKQEKHRSMRVTMARFPFQKSLESFDGKFQPSIEPKVIKELATGRFIADSENVRIPTNSSTCSGPNRPLVPGQFVHRRVLAVRALFVVSRVARSVTGWWGLRWCRWRSCAVILR